MPLICFVIGKICGFIRTYPVLQMWDLCYAGIENSNNRILHALPRLFNGNIFCILNRIFVKFYHRHIAD